MKKFLALALSCSLALTALAGCSGSGYRLRERYPRFFCS